VLLYDAVIRAGCAWLSHLNIETSYRAHRSVGRSVLLQASRCSEKSSAIRK
jgi:hypothetical protein